MKRLVLLAAVVVAATACSDDGGTSAAPTTTAASAAPTTTVAPATGPPVGVVAFGHSGLTGENSDPDHPREPAPENSWATGTNPEVDSIYQRMIERDPATEGHVANTAEGGSPSDDLVDQAEEALAEVPNPQLVIIQTIDSDIRCDGTDPDHVADFGDNVSAALDVVSTAAPDARILVMGQWGRPDPGFIAQLVDAVPEQQDVLTGTGMCDFYSPNGQLALAHFDALTGIIEAYEAEQARVCAQVPHCQATADVTTTYQDRLSSFSSDYAHLNVEGLHRVAELIWPTVEHLLDQP